MINYGRQSIDKLDIRAVTKVLKSNFITQGKEVEKFERLLSKKFGAKNCIAVSSGTAALHLLGIALGWSKNDIIITTPISFLATSNSILYSGAKPEFVDINKENFNIDTNLLLKKIIYLKKKRKKIAAIICTDFAGHPCNWKEIKKISTKYRIKLINDNCHAFGASIDNDKKYAIKYADYITLSFHAVKHITTGEGGAILTNDKKVAKTIRMLKTHGVIKDKRSQPWFYEMKSLGYNYRITDFQCALGFSQLKKLDKFVKRRKEIAFIYNKAFSNFPRVKIPKVSDKMGHAYHIYPLRIDFSKIKFSKEIFFKKLKKIGINLQVHYIPIHLQPYYKKKFNFKYGDFPVAEKFYDEEVSLPIFYGLQNSQIKFIISNIKKLIQV